VPLWAGIFLPVNSLFVTLDAGFGRLMNPQKLEGWPFLGAKSAGI
jgi:hypothetical protein